MHVLEVILRLVCVQRFLLLVLNQFNNKMDKRLFQQSDKVIVKLQCILKTLFIPLRSFLSKKFPQTDRQISAQLSVSSPISSLFDLFCFNFLLISPLFPRHSNLSVYSSEKRIVIKRTFQLIG